MYASQNDIKLLNKLQDIDREGTIAEKKLSELPYREEIDKIRKQRASVLKKKVQVQDMLDDAEDLFTKYFNEDEKLEIKQKDSETSLEQSSGDFRTIEARTKELNGIKKRRKTLADELEKTEEKINKIKPVLNQVLTVLVNLEKKEDKLISLYQNEGYALKQTIADSEIAHTSIASKIDSSVYAAYELAQARCGGIALAKLENDSCSACRMHFDIARLSTIQSDAPLSNCPNCRRLLIVEQSQEETSL